MRDYGKACPGCGAVLFATDGRTHRAIRSVGIHLMTLCLFIERGADPAQGTRLHRRMVEMPVFHLLAPPPARGSLTIVDMPVTGTAGAARDAAYAWASSAWSAWAGHHDTVRSWLAEAGFNRG